MTKVIPIFILFILLPVNETARILAFFSSPFISHQVVFRTFTQELANRGHEVTVVTSYPAFPNGKAPENLTEIDIHDVTSSVKEQMIKKHGWSYDLNDQMRTLYTSYIPIFEAQINSKEVKEIIKSGNTFDVLVLDGYGYLCLALIHVIKAPIVIQFSSLGAVHGQLENIGSPIQPFVYPSPFRKRIFNLTTWEKIKELYLIWENAATVADVCFKGHNMLKKYFGEDLPTIQELKKRIDLIFLNEYPLWSHNRPVPPNVVFVGGIHHALKKDVPEDLKTYLDSSKHGVIYMSFGSRFKTSLIPSEIIMSFIKAFSKLPYDVLWKWDEGELPGRSENIKISKWLPQADLLHHPNIKLFITQGGMQSTSEAITAGVPVIGIPLISDQWYNTEHYVQYGVGLQLDFRKLDENKLLSAINTVIEDKSYQANMVKLRELVCDQPMSPLDRAVWWTEHVIRHGGSRHLRTPAAHMPWADYYEIKLVLVILGIMMVTLLVTIGIASCLVRVLIKKLYLRNEVKNLKKCL